MKKSFTLLSSFVLLIMSSCHSEHEEHHEEDKYLVTSPLLLDTVITKEYVCQIQSIRHIELRTQERGYLQEIFVDEGKYVKQGQLLFQIMPKLYNAEVQIAQAEVDLAEIEYLNTKSLADSNVVSKNELAMAKAKFNKANAQLSLAQVHSSFTQIRAPFDGLLDRFQVRLGSLLDEGDLLTNLADNSRMWVYFNVPEAEYLEYGQIIKDGDLMKVKLLMANNKLFKHMGVVETVESDFDNETGNIAFRATFPNSEGLLRHGETGNIIVTVPVKNALIIPQKVTFEVLDKKYVFVVDKDNVIKTREVTIGIELSDLYQVEKGLAIGDKILLEGIRKVKENDTISFEYLDPKNVVTHLGLHAE